MCNEERIPSHLVGPDGAEMACGSKEFEPLSRFPKGKAGAGGCPPRRKHAACQQKALARSDAAGSPHKRAAAPLCIPRMPSTGSRRSPQLGLQGRLIDRSRETFTQNS